MNTIISYRARIAAQERRLRALGIHARPPAARAVRGALVAPDAPLLSEPMRALLWARARGTR